MTMNNVNATKATSSARAPWSKKKKLTVNLVLFLILTAAFAYVQFAVSPLSMAFMVLKKGIIYSLIAVSMNLLNGFTGLFSLGQAGFMLVGAYTYAIFTIPLANRPTVYQYYDGGIVQFTLPFLVAMLCGGIMAAIFAYLIGIPVLKLKSDYLAIATLGFAEIIRTVVQFSKFGPLTNSSNLLRKFTSLGDMKLKIGGTEIDFQLLFPYFFVALCIGIIMLLINSTYGRAFKAIRDDEVAAEAMGINLAKHKRTAFVISSFFAGLGGALFAMYQGTVQASVFKTSLTYEILLIVVIGGIGSVTGSVLASFLYVACSEWWLRFLDEETMIGTFKLPLLKSGFRMVVFSLIIMIIVLFFRRGIMGEKEFSAERIWNGITSIFRKNKKIKEETVNE